MSECNFKQEIEQYGFCGVERPSFCSINYYQNKDISWEWCFGQQGNPNSWRLLYCIEIDTNEDFLILTTFKTSKIISGYNDGDASYRVIFSAKKALVNGLSFAHDNPGKIPSIEDLIK